jgi:hypothetical protein
VKFLLILEIALLVAAFAALHRAMRKSLADAARWEDSTTLDAVFVRTQARAVSLPAVSSRAASWTVNEPVTGLTCSPAHSARKPAPCLESQKTAHAA